MLRAVPRHDVTDLVAQHAGQLSFGLEPLQQPFGDEHLAARQRKRVDRLGVVQDVEVVPVGALAGGALGHDPFTDLVHQRLQLGDPGPRPPNCCAISGAAWSPSATSCSGVIPATCCFSLVTGLNTLLP